MGRIIIGLDISKKNFDVALTVDGQKWLHRLFLNHVKGFEALFNWLQHKSVSSATVVLEATGRYGEDVAQFLYDKGFSIHVVNPAQIKFFGKSKLSRAKTDKKDARLIGEFALTHPHLKQWKPLSESHRKLRELYRYLVSLKGDRAKQLTRLESARDEDVHALISQHINFLNRQIKDLEHKIEGIITHTSELKEKIDLLYTIPCVGEMVAWGILSECPALENFQNAHQLAAFAGLNPWTYQSGTSVRGRGRISKVGSQDLRKLLYMPAMGAMSHNPVIKAFAQRLKDKGKNGKVIVVACMRKLLNIIYGVVTKQLPFHAG
jgi:transposase